MTVEACVGHFTKHVQRVFSDFKDMTRDSPIRSLAHKEASRRFQLFEEDEQSPTSPNLRRHLLGLDSTDPVQKLRVSDIWQFGNEGKGARIAVFDTGIHDTTPNIENIEERTDWTTENTLDDSVGHGTFVASLIGGSKKSGCGGIAPQSSILAFRVFNSKQKSFTSWFLDAFNYAMFRKVHVINLSIGGPDHCDQPFVDKINEVAAQGIVVVSANGNEGPLYGTTNNPADQSDVIGVGGIQSPVAMAPFSSRGMTLWELPAGYGRVKPDLVTWSRRLIGSSPGSYGGCCTLSGTSVAAPVVSGAVALIVSAMRHTPAVVNVASIKQILMPAATRMHSAHIYEQGAGMLSLQGADSLLKTFVPHVSLVPPQLMLGDCPYMWPHCTQPLYHSSMPLMFNVTVLNSIAVTSSVVDWSFSPTNELGAFLQVQVLSPSKIWPWSGHVGLSLSVSPQGIAAMGEARGELEVAVLTWRGDQDSVTSHVTLPIALNIIPTPPRHKRVLFSHYHSLMYPRVLAPRDDLLDTSDLLDWHGDHLHTNFHHMYMQLRTWGYFVEPLGADLRCFDAALYGTLMVVDPELAFTPLEIAKLEADIRAKGLGLVVFADWHSPDIMQYVMQVQLADDVTRGRMPEILGGANVPGINGLLEPFEIELSEDKVYSGTTKLANFGPVQVTSGSAITRFPAAGVVYAGTLQQLTVHQNLESARQVPILGLLRADKGRVVVFADSGCIDDAHHTAPCFGMLKTLLNFTSNGMLDTKMLPVVRAYHDTVFSVYESKAVVEPVGPLSCGRWTNNATAQDVVHVRWTAELESGSHFTNIDPSLQRDLGHVASLPPNRMWLVAVLVVLVVVVFLMRGTLYDEVCGDDSDDDADIELTSHLTASNV